MNELESVIKQWRELYQKNRDLRRVIYEAKIIIEELAFRNHGEEPYSDDFIVDFIKYNLDPHCKTDLGKTMYTVKERKGKIPYYKCEEKY